MKRLTVWLLALGIVMAMVVNSAEFFFRRPYYEYWDLAANSLSILRAKHFAELYGAYSRWGFHHPGPALFYVHAFGEWMFYDVLRLTPAPCNAQVLIQLCSMTGFFVAALGVFSRWLSAPARRWFVPGALVLAVLHFGAVARLPSYDMLLGSPVFTMPWGPHALVFPFLCLLVAGASVAAGRGEDLPLLALAGSLLVHMHVAQPLFVGPLSLAAYAGLLVTAIRHERASGGVPARWRPGLAGAAWRAFPRRHVVALCIVSIFALPLLIDLCLGDGSNFHAVLTHMRTNQGHHKSFARSLFYFVQFGAYRPYKAHEHMFTRFDKAGAYAYLWYHKKIYAAWIVGVLLVIWATAVRPAWAAVNRRRAGAPSAPVNPAAPLPVIVTPDRARFMAWAGAFLLSSILLTLYWGIIQDGDMFYYNSWFNFAIYYFGLLVILAEISPALAAWAARWQDRTRLPDPTLSRIERAALAGIVLVVFALHADRFRVRDPSPDANRAMHESNLLIIQDARARNPNGLKVFDCPFFVWPAVTGLALEMARQGQPFSVAYGLSAEHFSVPFGTSYLQRPSSPEVTRRTERWSFRRGKLWQMWVSGLPKWYVPVGKALEAQLTTARREKAEHGEVAFYPMLDHVELRVGMPIVSLRGDGAALDFHKGGRGPGAALYGFSDPETWGTWNSGRSGGLRFRGEPVVAAEDVEISLDAHPFLAPDASLYSQRVNVAVDGTLLGPEQSLSGDETVTYTVPGALWNRTFGQRAGGALEFDFPDVASPAAINGNGDNDTRLLGVGLYAIRFRAVPAVHSQPMLNLDGPEPRAELDFKRGGDALTFQSDGWYDPETWGTWSQGHTSRLHFHSTLVEGTHDVEITLDIRNAMDTDSGIKGQRIRASLGEIPFDRERFVERAGKLVLTVPATVWNAAVADDADAVLQLDFPDAVSPARCDPTGKEKDGRQLALGIERMSFRVVPVPVVTAP